MLTPETIHLWGDTVCLDYANSVVWSADHEHADPEHTDVLRTPDMLQRWGCRLGLLSDRADPPSAIELRRSRTLRDALHRVFVAVSEENSPPAADTDVLMRTYVEAVSQATLVAHQHHYRLDWPPHDARRVRYAVAADALALLSDPDRLRRVTHCPGRHCGWLFLNLSGRRRWCSMSTCGSREKMRRYHHKR